MTSTPSMPIKERLRKIQQQIRSYNQDPATIDAVDEIVGTLSVLESRIKELEAKTCCKDDTPPETQNPSKKKASSKAKKRTTQTDIEFPSCGHVPES